MQSKPLRIANLLTPKGLGKISFFQLPSIEAQFLESLRTQIAVFCRLKHHIPVPWTFRASGSGALDLPSIRFRCLGPSKHQTPVPWTFQTYRPRIKRLPTMCIVCGWLHSRVYTGGGARARRQRFRSKTSEGLSRSRTARRGSAVSSGQSGIPAFARACQACGVRLCRGLVQANVCWLVRVNVCGLVRANVCWRVCKYGVG